MTQKIKNLMLMVMLTAVVCVGTVSALQLRTTAKPALTCSGSCSATKACSNGCFCSFTTPFTAFCTSRPAGLQPPAK